MQATIYRVCSILFLIILGGCSELNPKLTSESDELLLIQEYVEKYGAITSPSLSQYFERLIDNLVANSSLAIERTPRLIVLNSAEPMAFCAGNQYIILSKQLICLLPTEAELAFVVAHELGHQKLGHYAEASRSIEFDADKFALHTLERANYDIDKALLIFTRFPFLHVNSQADSYPSTQTRHEMAMGIAKKLTLIPGTYTNRWHKNLLSSLCN